MGRLTVPWNLRVAISMGGPAIWWLPKFEARLNPTDRRSFVHGGWLLWSFYIEVERLNTAPELPQERPPSIDEGVYTVRNQSSGGE